MSASDHGWLPPRCDSRTGAAHRRRGAVCQDASGHWCFGDAAGRPLQVLVVSDGHGGARYDRSEVGSRLACQVALEAVQAQLSRADVGTRGSQDEWRLWLAQSLPRRIVEDWQRAVLSHARSHPRSDGAAPSTVPYGATLGLLLLTPGWWGYTGLGDWDLLRLDAGGGELVSEEPDHPGGGEATFSLCMEGAERHFAARSDLVPIAATEAPFSLLLSSDGIRKSCASDADFLTLARYLGDLPTTAADGAGASELGQALDHISSQGSGDDVSVVIGRWGSGALPPRRQGRRRGSAAVIVQPAPSDPGETTAAPAEPVAAPLPAAGGPEGRALPDRPWPWWLPWAGGAVLLSLCLAAVAAAALLGLRPFATREAGPQRLDRRQLAVLQSQADDLCAPGGPQAGPPAAADESKPSSSRGTADDGRPGAGPAHERGDDGPDSIRPDRPRSRPQRPSGPELQVRAEPDADARYRRRLLVLDPPAPPPAGTGDPRLDPVRLEMISASLNQRKALFRALRAQQQTPAAVLAVPARDPLSSLIAWSYLQPGLGPGAPGAAAATRSPGLAGWLMPWWRGEPPQQTAGPRLCPELDRALRQQWQRLDPQAGPSRRGAAPGPGSTGTSPAAPDRSAGRESRSDGAAPGPRPPRPARDSV